MQASSSARANHLQLTWAPQSRASSQVNVVSQAKFIYKHFPFSHLDPEIQ
jgi:hypothetical protein